MAKTHTDAVLTERLISAVEKLLEWVPRCSKGSSGDIRVTAVTVAIQDIRKDQRG